MTKRTLFSASFATTVTFSTLLIASFLNNESASRNPPKHSTPIVLKTAKEQPKVKKRVKRKQKKLKNIKQAPRVSPNFAITMDIPLEMPQVQDMHTELIEQAVEVVPPAPKADNPAPEYPRAARSDGIQGRVVAMARVDEYGFVIRTKILSSDPPGVFDAAVTSALRNWKFSPATMRGHPIEQWVEIPFNFVM